MNKHMTKQVFGVPSLETATRIDDSDATNAACAAHFRFTVRMRELEAHFKTKASELRANFLHELSLIHEGEGQAQMATPGQITHLAENALRPIISLCQSVPSPPGGRNAAMKASLLELSAYLQTLATQLANQAATL
jgi:hypothetical protein